MRLRDLPDSHEAVRASVGETFAVGVEGDHPDSAVVTGQRKRLAEVPIVDLHAATVAGRRDVAELSAEAHAVDNMVDRRVFV